MCNWVTMLHSRKLSECCKPAITKKIKSLYIKKLSVYSFYSFAQFGQHSYYYCFELFIMQIIYLFHQAFFSPCFLLVLSFKPYSSVHCCEWGVKVSYYDCIPIDFSFYVCQYLSQVSGCSYIGGIYIDDCNILFLNESFYH